MVIIFLMAQSFNDAAPIGQKYNRNIIFMFKQQTLQKEPE